MPVFTNRPNTALIVVDMQKDVVSRALRRDSVIANITSLVETARAKGIPVVWVQQTGDGLEKDTDGWQIVPGLSPLASEPVIYKLYGDSFEDTNLEAVLADLAVGHLIVTGAQTDQCVRSTIHGAFTRGYDTTLVGDAHTTEDNTEWGAPSPDQVIAHTNLNWKYHDGPGRKADVVLTADVGFSGIPAPTQ